MFCLCLCPCSVYVPSRNLYLLGWPLKEHFLFKSPSECLCSVWGSGYVSLAHYYRRSITFQPCSFNVQSTVLSCSIYVLFKLQFCWTHSGQDPAIFCLGLRLCSVYGSVYVLAMSCLQFRLRYSIFTFFKQLLAMFRLCSVKGFVCVPFTVLSMF